MAALLAVFSATGNSQAVGRQPQPFVIHRPTIVAFFPPVTESELNSDADTNEALSDFQLYADQVQAPLRKAGIDFHVANARSFKIRIGTTIRTFQTGKDGVGYYLIAPGKRPQIEYGVMTNADLIDVARKYFGGAIQ